MNCLRCISCCEEITYKKLIYSCPKCGGLLDVIYDYETMVKELDRDRITSRNTKMWKWKEFLPVLDESNIVTLGEGATPLIKCDKIAREIGVKEVYIKDDALTNPTGSLKDRQISVAVSKALEFGYDSMFTITSGNNGVSLAAYAAKAGLGCIVIFSAGATNEKMIMTTALGANAIKIVGEDSSVAATISNVLDGKDLKWYDCGFRTFEPFMYEGRKTNAFEVCESLNWINPDRVLHPSVGSMGVIKAWKGYKELHSMGWTEGPLPKMTVVQPTNVAPIVKAYTDGLDKIEPVDPGDTIAGAIACADSGDLGNWTLNVLKQSNGEAVSVTDVEIIYGLKLLASEGIFVEPSAAVTIPALKKMVNQGKVHKDERVVCEITGAGWKFFDMAKNIYGIPKVLSPNVNELKKFLQKYI